MEDRHKRRRNKKKYLDSKGRGLNVECLAFTYHLDFLVEAKEKEA